jgi:mono/diheme cytochrome c family protein
VYAGCGAKNPGAPLRVEGADLDDHLEAWMAMATSRGGRTHLPGPCAPLAAVLCAALALPGILAAQEASPPPFTEEQAEAGAGVYSAHCAQCHGPALKGTVAPPLVGKAFRANWYVGDRTLGDLFDQIARYMPMTAPGSLTKEQYAALTAFILLRNGHEANGDVLVADREALGAYPLVPPGGEPEEEGR